MTFPIFKGFERLSSSVGGRVMAGHTSWVSYTRGQCLWE